MTRKAVLIDNPALDDLPLSPAVKAGKLLYVSGQVGLDPETNALVNGGAAGQTAQALRNLETVLTAAGKALADVVKVNIYLAYMDDYTAMNEVYAAAFDKPYPARTCVGVAGLPLNARVEIEAVAR